MDGKTDLNDDLTVNNMASTHLTGDLDIDKTLNVDGTTTLNDDLTVTDMAPTHLTGSLDVDKTLNVDGASTLNGDLTVTGMSNTHLTGDLTVDKDAEVGGGMLVKGSGFFSGSQSTYNDYVMRVEGGQQGLAVKLTNTNPGRNENYISFWGGSGTAKGRIEGFQGLQGNC